MLRIVAGVVGLVLLGLGALSFVQQIVLNMFAVGFGQGLLYLACGILLLGVAALMPAQTALWLRIMGGVFALLALAGYLLGGDALGVAINTPSNNHLHAALAVLLLVSGFMGRAEHTEAA